MVILSGPPYDRGMASRSNLGGLNVEQAAASTLTGLFAQLGVAGLVLAILVAGAAWYLKASKELRDEKRSVIADLKKENKELAMERDKLKEDLLDCRFPNRNGGVSNESS